MTEAVAGSRTRSWRAADAVLLGLAVATAAYVTGHLLLFPYGRDQGIYAVVASIMLDGGAPYQAAWDFKPPGVFGIYAISEVLFGAAMHGIRILEAVALASLFWAFAILSRRFVGNAPAGILGAAIAVIAHVQMEFWNTAQPESFGGVALIWAIVGATSGRATASSVTAGVVSRNQILAWSGAGALYSLAALLKPPLGGGILVSTLLVVRERRLAAAGAPRSRALLAPILAFAVGGALPLVLTLLAFAGSGALGDLYDALFVFAPRYTAIGLASENFLLLMLKAIGGWLFGSSPYHAVGLICLFAFRPLSSRDRQGALHVLGVGLPVLVGVALQAKFFPYHFAALVPLTALAAGWGLWKLWLRLRGAAPGWLATAVLAYLLSAGHLPLLPDTAEFWHRCDQRLTALWNPGKRARIRNRLYSKADVNVMANVRVARWLQNHTPEGSSLYIWGFEPVIYGLSGRRPASRYIYNVPQRVPWNRTQSRARLMDDLAASPPAAIVLLRGDIMPQVTGDSQDSRQVLRGFADLQRLIRSNYEAAMQIEDMDILVPKDDAGRREEP